MLQPRFTVKLRDDLVHGLPHYLSQGDCPRMHTPQIPSLSQGTYPRQPCERVTVQFDSVFEVAESIVDPEYQFFETRRARFQGCHVRCTGCPARMSRMRREELAPPVRALIAATTSVGLRHLPSATRRPRRRRAPGG